MIDSFYQLSNHAAYQLDQVSAWSNQIQQEISSSHLLPHILDSYSPAKVHGNPAFKIWYIPFSYGGNISLDPSLKSIELP